MMMKSMSNTNYFMTSFCHRIAENNDTLAGVCCLSVFLLPSEYFREQSQRCPATRVATLLATALTQSTDEDLHRGHLSIFSSA